MAKKTTKRWHSSIKIERPSTTWLGRVAQKMRIRRGEIQLHEHSRLSPAVARELFPLPFRVFDRLPYNSTHPTEQMSVSTSYSLKSKSCMSGCTTLYHRTRLEERVKWTLCLCNGEADLTILCSGRFYDSLILEMSIDDLQGWI